MASGTKKRAFSNLSFGAQASWQPNGDRASWMRGNLICLSILAFAGAAYAVSALRSAPAFPTAAQEVSAPPCMTMPSRAKVSSPACLRAVADTLDQQ